MNKKYALVSIVLIALMSLSLVPMAAFGFHTPSSTDDNLFEATGPRVSQILIKVYTDYTTELAGFKAKEIDVMDWGLEPIDYAWFESNDPTHAQYATAFYAEFGAFEYDLNCQVLPTMLVSVRQAFAHLIDKQYFINTYLGGLATKLDSVLNYLGTGWYWPGATDLYNFQPRTTMTPLPDDPADWEAAYDLLLADLGPPVPDPGYPGAFMWYWPSPFTTPDPSGTYPPVADGHLLMFARSEMDPRVQQGLSFENYMEVVFPDMMQALGKQRVRMYVDLYVVPRAVTSKQVFQYYRYHLYTGGWSLGRDPDFIIYYTIDFIAKPDPGGGNYVMYANPLYDAEVYAMIASASPGSSGTPSDGIYHAWQAQEIMENDEPVIWVWSFAGYKAYLSSWSHVINQVGFGVNSWWTFMDAYKTGGTGYGDIIRYGWAGDLLSLNIISAQWLWDYELLNKVYDSLISVNPYNMADDRPWVAQSWTVGTWEYTPGGTETTLTFAIRPGVYWQDVPYKDRHAIAVGGGTQIDGPFENYQVTPVDIVFSWKYQVDNPDSWSGYLASNVFKVGLNPAWQTVWEFDVSLPPWWDFDPLEWNYNYVEWDAGLAVNEVKAYFDVAMPWLALHWVGGMWLIPFHIWSEIPISTSDAVDTWQYDIVYGCGPFILLSRTPGVQNVLVDFSVGQSYRGVTTDFGFWNQVPGATISISQMTAGATNVGWLQTRNPTYVGYQLSFAQSMRIRNTYAVGVNVNYWFGFRVEIWTGVAWVPRYSTTTAISSILVPAGSTVLVVGSRTITPSQLEDDVAKLFGHVRVYYSYHVDWTGGTRTFENPAPEEFLTSAADITGDGIVNIADATLIGTNWQNLWYP